MKILWQVSFRPFNKSATNNKVQNHFIDNLIKFKADLTLCVTQFDDFGVKNFLKNKKIKTKYFNYPKKKLPKNVKYSNSIMLKNSLKFFLQNDFDYFIFSNADIIISKKIIKILKFQRNKNYMGFVYPNTLVKNGKKLNSYKPHYGIDFIAFKLTKKRARLFLKLLKYYEQYNWGVIDNFYIAIGDALNLKFENLFKQINVIKIENKFSDFKENREWQIKNWKINNNYFKKFLIKTNLSIFYSIGSYYYLIYKFFRFKDLNLKLAIIYVLFFLTLPSNLIKKLFKKVFL